MKRTLVWSLMALLSLRVTAQPQDKKVGNETKRTIAVAPLYAFDGAEAQYKIGYGSTSSTATMTVSVTKELHRLYCTVAIRYTGQLAPLSRDGKQLCDNGNRPFWVGRSDFRWFKEWHKGRALPMGWGADEVQHSVAVSVPAGKFMTEEIHASEATAHYESGSGLLVRIEGNLFKGSDQFVPELKGVNKATMVLIETNIPLTVASTGN